MAVLHKTMRSAAYSPSSRCKRSWETHNTMRHSTMLIAGCLVLAALQVVAQNDLQIARNTDDCINPAITSSVNAPRLFPTSKYMISGTKVTREDDGGILIQNRAGFQAKYYSTYKIVTNLVSTDSNFNAKPEVYVLYNCGSPRPTNIPAGAKVFEVPLRSISADDTSGAEFLKQCDAIDRVAYVSKLSVSGCYQALAKCGYDANDPLYNAEEAAAIDPQVDAFVTFSAVNNPKSIALNAAAANSPLLRAEWFKFMATFVNKEWEAETLYRTIRNNYNSLSRAAVAEAGKRPKKTVVAWVYLGWNADFVITKAPYKVAYVQDAGGVMVSDDVLKKAGMTPGPIGVSWSMKQAWTDEWASVLSQVDVIIDETYVQSTGGYTTLAQFVRSHFLSGFNIPAVANKAVYSIAGAVGQPVQDPESGTATVGMDWFERGTSRCDEVLRDFVLALTLTTQHPTMNGWNRKWLLKLDGTQSQYKAPIDCPNDTAALDALCRRVPFPVHICPNVVRNCTTGVLTYPLQAKRCDAVSAQKAEIRQRRKDKITPVCMIK